MSRPINICKIESCNTNCFGHGYCSLHYQRWRRTKDPENNHFITESHGMWGTPEYRSWNAMKNRCLQVNHKHYKYYGGRGITVCQKWVESFSVFYEDMGLKPSPSYSIERINRKGDYTPSNCRWATRSEQANNTNRNRFIEINGKTRTFTQWVRHYNRSLGKVRGRYYSLGWTIERALDI